MRPLLIVLEGANDIAFLVRLSERLRIDLPHVPDLRPLQLEGRIALLPVGGGDSASWPHRFQALGCSKFHLYDREQLPETDNRRRTIATVNSRHGCRGFLTSKRSLENYLHPQAIVAAGGGDIAYADDEPVCLRLARSWYETNPACPAWDSLPRRTQRRLAGHAKRWLNTAAVEQMTAALLAERDPQGELIGWLMVIAEMECRSACAAPSVA